MTKSLFLKVA